jgi:EpsI family protein
VIRRAAILFVCFIATAGFIARASRPEQVPPRAPLEELPMQFGEWSGVAAAPFEPRILATLGVDDYLTRFYGTDGKLSVGLYVGFYESQRQGDTIHSPLNCLPGSGWAPVSKSTIDVQVAQTLGSAGPVGININRYVVEKGLDRELVLYWYQSHGRITADEYMSKFYLIRDAVRLNRTDGALVRVMAPIAAGATDDRRAEDTAVRFVKALFPLLSDYLPS